MSNVNDDSNVINDGASVASDAKANERAIIADIERAITVLLEDRSYENLAYLLTLIRNNIEVELIVAVKGENGGLALAPVKTSDGQRFFAMFTSFDEQLKGPSKVQSTYEVSFKSIFDFVRNSNDIDGVMINPWGKPFILNRKLIDVVLGEQ
ncbi:MAG: SseB family protein [Clostridia bacterium]|nr:SseB family protein [Clostridia bacterium]